MLCHDNCDSRLEDLGARVMLQMIPTTGSSWLAPNVESDQWLIQVHQLEQVGF